MPHNTEWNKNYATLADGGSVYTETNLENFIVEPWNAVSSLAIILPAVYWLYKLRGKYKENWFLTCCIPLLFLGGLGSTLYHAFRTSSFLLLLDFLPILVLSFVVGVHLWMKVLKKWTYVGLLFLIIIAFRIVVPDMLSHHDAINLRYFINGCMIFLPGLMLVIINKGKGSVQFSLALVFFILALVCRKIDAFTPALLGQGTHWLWHIFTGIGTVFLSQYLFLLEKMTVQTRKGKFSFLRKKEIESVI